MSHHLILQNNDQPDSRGVGLLWPHDHDDSSPINLSPKCPSPSNPKTFIYFAAIQLSPSLRAKRDIRTFFLTESIIILSVVKLRFCFVCLFCRHRCVPICAFSKSSERELLRHAVWPRTANAVTREDLHGVKARCPSGTSSKRYSRIEIFALSSSLSPSSPWWTPRVAEAQ